MAARFDVAEGEITESDQPAIINLVVLAQADVFAREGSREIELFAARQSQHALRTDAADIVTGGVVELRQRRGTLYRRGPVDGRGRLHAQRFVGAVLVELLDERIEAFLLLEQVRARGARGLVLERAMHPLVAP